MSLGTAAAPVLQLTAEFLNISDSAYVELQVCQESTSPRVLAKSAVVYIVTRIHTYICTYSVSVIGSIARFYQAWTNSVVTGSPDDDRVE